MIKKVSMAFLMCCGLCSFIYGQRSYDRLQKSEFNIGVDAVKTLNGWKGDGIDFNDKLLNVGLGLSIKYIYNLDNIIATTFQLGYTYFPGSDLKEKWSSLNVHARQLALKGGLRFKTHKFYIEPQFGVSSFRMSLSDKTVDYKDAGKVLSPFTYALGLGVMASKSLDIGLRYEGMSNHGSLGYLGLGIAYRLPLEQFD